jgi:outer membrane receptor for ferrienterochelin and colicins
MRKTLQVVVCCLLASLVALPAFAQQGATVSGRVVDARDGQPLAGANVLLLRPGSTTHVVGAATDVDGRYRLTGVEAGSYNVVVRYIGYIEQRQPITLGAGESAVLNFRIEEASLNLHQVIVTASRSPEKVLDAPASISILSAQEIAHDVTVSSDAILRNTPGVDMAQTGIDRREVVLRGFNNAFSGAAYVVTDYRRASVPSLAVNLFSIMPNMPLDLERIEVVRGPGSALYGAGADGGVIHFMTKDPFNHPGTSFSLAGGERSMFSGQLRHAGVVARNFGYKVTGSFARGDDWSFDPGDPLDQAELVGDFIYPNGADVPSWQQIDPTTRRLVRNYDYSRYNINGLLQYRLTDRAILSLNGGHSALTGIVLSGIGTLQGEGFGYSYGQIRLDAGSLFAQAYINRNEAGNSYVYGTGMTVIDKGMLYSAQAQYTLGLDGLRSNVILGADAEITAPDTEGTIIGRNEGETIELYGIYAQSSTALTDQFDLTVALRSDYNNVDQQIQLSPRAAVVYKLNPGNSFRATYNRAFSTPGTNSLFLDIEAQRRVLGPRPGGGTYDLAFQARGTATPFTFNNFRDSNAASFSLPVPGFFGSQVNLGNIPLVPIYGAAAAGVVPVLLSGAALPGLPPLSPQQRQLLAQLLGYTAQSGSLGTRTTGAVQLGVPDGRLPAGYRPVEGPVDLERLKPTISETYEVGYKGLLANRLLLAVDGYYANKRDFVGPLSVESPLAYLRGTGLATDVGTALGQVFGTTTDANIQGLLAQLNNAGLPPALVTQILAGLVGGALNNLPTAVVQPDQPIMASPNPNEVAGFLGYRNYGQIRYFGADFAAQYIATDRVSLFGNLSWVSDDFFDNEQLKEDNVDLSVALNAPTFKTRAGFVYAVPAGLTFNAAARFTKGFPVRSGPYIGDVEDRFLVDLGFGYDFTNHVSGLRMDVSVQNVLDDQNREFIGAPKIGRMAMARLTYTL